MNFFADEPLSLDRLRSALMRMEDTIIFGLIERGQFKVNNAIYTPAAFPFKSKFEGSFLDYFLSETEKLHATVRRYTSPDENPFSDNLPDPVLPLLSYPRLVKPNNINVNHKIKPMYINQIIPSLCETGDDTNYGSAATVDVQCLQNISRRIHYGKFIAEAKFADPQHTEEYTELIRQQDADALMELLTNREVEKKLLARLHKKASMYGQDLDSLTPAASKIDPSIVVTLYEKWIIPLTKEVEVDYLLQRLDLEDAPPSASVPNPSETAPASAVHHLKNLKKDLLPSHRGSETRFFFLETPASQGDLEVGRKRGSSDLQ